MSTEIQLPHFPPPRGRSSLRIFFTSLWSFILRELMNRFGTSRIGYLWALLDPLATITMFMVLRVMIRRGNTPMYDTPAIFFFSYGIVPFFMFRDAMHAPLGTLDASSGLFNYRQIRPIDLMLAKSIIDYCLLGVVFLLFALICIVYGFGMPCDDVAGVLLGFIAAFALGASLGLVFEVFGTVWPPTRRAVAIINRPLFLLSGPFYTIKMIPEQWQPYLLWNPVLHVVDLTRGAALTGYDSPGSWVYVFTCVAVFLFIGLATYRRYAHELL